MLLEDHGCDFFFSLENFILIGILGFFNKEKPYFKFIKEKVFRQNFAVKWCKTPHK